MTSGSERPEEGLGERLRELDATDSPGSEAQMDRMFTDMKARCDKNDRTLTGFLRSRSTMARRLIVLSVFSVLAFAGWFAFPLIGDNARTVPWTASLVTFCVLLVVAMLILFAWRGFGIAARAADQSVVAAAAQAAGADPGTEAGPAPEAEDEEDSEPKQAKGKVVDADFEVVNEEKE